MQLPARNTALACLSGVAAGVLVAAAGYAIYFSVFDQRPDLSSDTSSNGRAINYSESISNSQSIHSGAELEALLESKSAFNRSLTIRGLLVNADESVAKKIFRFAEDVKSIAVEKLASIDPQDSLKFIDDLEKDRKSPLVEIVFRVWARSDLDRSIELAISMDETGRQSAFAGILASDSLPSQQALDIATRLNSKQMFFDYSAARLLQEPLEDPESAFKSLLSLHGQRIDDFSELESQYLVRVVQSWIARNGVDAIRDAAQHLTTDSARASMLSHLFVQEEDNALALAVFTSIYAMDTDIANRSIEQWAEIEPLRAFQFASALDDDKARIRLSRAAISSWSQSNPLSLLDNMDELPPGLRDSFRTDAMFVLSDTHPEQAAQRLDEMPDSVAKKGVAASIAWEWGARDPRGALDWVLSDPLGDGLNPQGQDLRYPVFNGAFRVNPELALELALEQPLDEDAIGFEASLLGHLASEDAEAALEMVRYTRNWETRKRTYRNIGKAFIEEGKAERAMEMVQGETGEFQTLFFRSMMFDWVESDAQGMYASLDTLPTIEIQALGSEMLLLQHEREPFLNNEQVERLQSIASNLQTTKQETP